MPIDYYPNLSVTDLESLLARIQKRQSLGSISQVTAAGQTTRKDFTTNSKAEIETLRVLYSLYLRTHDIALNPIPGITVYDDPYKNRIRRTRAFYINS